VPCADKQAITGTPSFFKTITSCHWPTGLEEINPQREGDTNVSNYRFCSRQTVSTAAMASFRSQNSIKTEANFISILVVII